MKIINNLCKFGTLYLWILALKVLQVSAEYRTDTAATLIMKPYPYQIFDDYMDELLNERNVATPLWPTKDKHLYYKHFPLTKAKTAEDIGNSMASNEMAFENLNDFDSYKIKNAIWPRDEQRQKHPPDTIDDKFKRQRHSLQHVDVFDKLTPVTNIRYENGILPIIMANRLTKEIPTTKSKTFTHDVNDDDDVDGDDDATGVRNDNNDAAVKDNIFPLKGDDALNVDIDGGDDENEFATSSGNGNESINYSDDNKVYTNYMVSHNVDVNDKGIDKNHLNFKHIMNDKRAKLTHGQTPFLPSVSGGAMTNLGKFFRDLSKNVHFSEQNQWGSEDQKLLEGDPNFGNIPHHLTKPKSTSDQQTSEWIKAIRFYRPSQKIRSLVAMNPHGQWAHSSQFIDPNYMWVGLGK